MLIELILTPVFWIIESLLSVIPAFSLPSGFSGSLSSFFTLLGSGGYFLPLGTMSIILGLYLSFYAVKFAISAINWLIAKIPTIN